MADTGISRMMNSEYWKKVVWPAFKAKYPVDASKVESELRGVRRPWPSSAFAKGIVEELRRDDPVPSPPPPPPPPPPPSPWDSGFAPQAYNQGGSGQNARYNVRINCTRRADGNYVDGQNIVYDDGGRSHGGRSEKFIPQLKPADQMDGKEPWDRYIHNNLIIGPNREDYPEASYER
jgi:hypothetical protein